MLMKKYKIVDKLKFPRSIKSDMEFHLCQGCMYNKKVLHYYFHKYSSSDLTSINQRARIKLCILLSIHNSFVLCDNRYAI